jgi:hypothetical protein
MVAILNILSISEHTKSRYIVGLKVCIFVCTSMYLFMYVQYIVTRDENNGF